MLNTTTSTSMIEIGQQENIYLSTKLLILITLLVYKYYYKIAYPQINRESIILNPT